MSKYEVVYRNEFEADSEEQARALALQDIEVEMAALQVYEQKPQLVSVNEGIANVCAELGSPLSQEEINTLLTNKSGGMYNE